MLRESAAGVPSQAPDSLIDWGFNQDATCLAVATRRGLRIFNCETGQCCYEEAIGVVRIVEMLYCTSLLVISGAGEQPTLSPRKVTVLNTSSKSSIADLHFPSAVLSVRINRERLVAVLERRVIVHVLATLQALETIETEPNPQLDSDPCTGIPNTAQGLAALTSIGRSWLALPSKPTDGTVVIRDAGQSRTICEVAAHRSSLAVTVFNQDGSLLATASTKGTVVRVFSLPQAKLEYSFRRGSRPARIYSVAFTAAGTQSPLLVVSSDGGTVHLFRLGPSSRQGASNAAAAVGIMSSVLPGSLRGSFREAAETQRATAIIRLPSGKNTRVVCAVTQLHPSDPDSSEQGGGSGGGARVLVASADGVYQEYRVVGLLAGTEPIVSLERETKLLPPGTGAGEAAGSARWLLDGEGGGSPPSGSGSGGGRDSSSGNPNGNNNGGGGGMGFQFHGEHLEMSVSQSLSQSIMGGFG